MNDEQPTTSGSFTFSHEVVCGHCGRLLGNYYTSRRDAGVLVPMGRAIARAVKRAMGYELEASA